MHLSQRATLGLSALAALSLAAVHPAQAQTTFTAYNVTPGTTGNQNYNGPLGMDFHVNQEIAVTQLGVFDSGSDGLSSDLNAAIYKINADGSGTSLASQVFTSGTGPTSGVLEGGSRFLNLATPLYLAPGDYSIVAGYYGSEGNYNQGFINNINNTTSTENTGGGLISFIGGSRYGYTQGDFPTIIDSGPTNRYDAGTFQYTATPEPSSVAAFTFTGLGAAGLMLKARKRKSPAA